jgi:hypothetical protein
MGRHDSWSDCNAARIRCRHWKTRILTGIWCEEFLRRRLLPHPWPVKPSHNGASYEVTHLAPITRAIVCSDSVERKVQFRFGYHCFTETRKPMDATLLFRDLDYPDEQRVLCRERWYLSWRLVRFINGLEKERFIDAGGAQWQYNHRIQGIDRPYSIFLKFSLALLNQPMIINVNSAYIKADARLTGNDTRFDVLLTKAATSSKVPGR